MGGALVASGRVLIAAPAPFFFLGCSNMENFDKKERVLVIVILEIGVLLLFLFGFGGALGFWGFFFKGKMLFRWQAPTF